ncbi:hypothetical protein HMPREF1531_00438 [Propionibacterium sp. oral taxon 192 str. F0372]|nr:hypothetical protein HMPREF1531_00438 [Propionibacterium sp. oral taxon 192 str. F0372]
MTRWPRRSVLLASMTAFALLTGCTTTSTDTSPSSPSPSGSSQGTTKASLSGTEFPITVTDFNGDEVVIEQAPTRVVICSGTALNIWYDAGGKAVASADLTDSIRLSTEHAAEMQALPKLGAMHSIDQEAVLAQNPDLVITMGAQKELAASLKSMGINTMAVKVSSLADLTMAYSIFGALSGTSDHATSQAEQITASTQQVVSKWPGEERSVVVLFVTAQSLSVKLDESITGHMLSTLGVRNIASGATPENPNSENTPLDVEYIVAHQPDTVLVTSMISSNQEARARIEAEFAKNSAWQAIDAVRENRVVFLPQQYFLYNAGPYYPDAMTYLAASLRPDVFGNPVEP